MMFQKIGISVILLFMFLPLASANGLTLNTTDISVNKSAGADQQVILSIQNTETFSFFNVTFEPNPYISMPIISEIQPGQITTFSATVFGDEDIVIDLNIFGFYFSQIGQSSQTIDVLVFPHDVDVCDFTIVEGDTVRWNSSISDDIILRRSDGSPVSTIAQNGEYSLAFSVGESFAYYFTRLGFPFPSGNCVITVLSATGFVNDPELDAVLNLDVNVVYPPTTLFVDNPVKDYTLNFFDNTDGILSITNAGNETARNVILTGEWLSFSDNDFDIIPGQTKGIIYTISPDIFITEETNITYNKTLSVIGNFPQHDEILSIFINPAIISNDLNDSGSGGLAAFIEEFCLANPGICNAEPKIIFKDPSGNNQEFNVTMTQEQVNELFISMFQEKEARETLFNFIKENLDSQQIRQNVTDISIEALNSQFSEYKDEQESTQIWVYWILLMGLFFFVVGGLIVVGIILRRRKRYEDLMR